MKKFSILLLSIFLAGGICAYADDLWDNFGDSNVYGQKAVSEEDFQKALESKKTKKSPFGKTFSFKKQKNKDVPQGESYSQSNESEIISNTKAELPVLMIPIPLKVNENYIIPIGHYQVEGEKNDDGEVYIKLYQAHDLIAKIPAEETSEEYEDEAINFVKLEPHGETHVEIIFGCLDFNAFAVIDTE